ncbi:hypothetical protein GGS24DRAFT_507368 [Hypoxylon argillaceum]|nr:hypothetical protein GGS24DRAFT_507368 [Hypoxylon argillaceum]
MQSLLNCLTQQQQQQHIRYSIGIGKLFPFKIPRVLSAAVLTSYVVASGYILRCSFGDRQNRFRCIKPLIPRLGLSTIGGFPYPLSSSVVLPTLSLLEKPPPPAEHW